MKILLLDLDGVLNNTRSALTKTGLLLQTEQQRAACIALQKNFGDDDQNIPYGPKFTIETIDPVSVGLVNRLFDKDDQLYFVLSSSHRSMFCGSNYKLYGQEIQFGSEDHLAALRVYMTALGLRGNRLHDVTPRLYCPRGKEVRAWLDEHGDQVTHHCAVDDGADFDPSDCTFVQTSGVHGLLSDDFFKIAQHLEIYESTIIY